MIRIVVLLLMFDVVAAADGFAEIRVVDAETGRGVPLVELQTVNATKFVTDNAGRVAFLEPDLMGRDVFFSVRSHGYAMKKDGFGFTGTRVTPRAGSVCEIKLPRTNIAERMGRLTGEGLFRDSALLGHTVPPVINGRVIGQDSLQAAIYRCKVFWLWGDTQRSGYQLVLFRSAGATSDPKADPAEGIAYDYFVDAKTKFAKALMPLTERPKGVIWIFSLFVVDDKLVAHYSRRQGLGEVYEHGICTWNDERAIFEPTKQLPLTDTWRYPKGHPIRHEGWWLFGSPNPNVRVPASLAAVLDTTQYEAYTCAGADGKPIFGSDGQPAWHWQKDLPPTDSKREAAWVKAGVMKPEQTRFLPSGVTLHSGSVRWNAHRQKWLLLAGQVGGTSYLGEVWYSEANAPNGPFRKAVKVVTHDKQTFYNVVHHDFFDSGSSIYFEGTYTSDFSGNPMKTPRYDYNQVLYRLDLDHANLRHK